MATGSGYEAEIIRDRLSKLVGLYDTTDTLKGQIASIRGSQTSSVWSSGVPSVARFASTYRSNLLAIEQQLEAVRDDIEAGRQALHDTWKSLELTDAGVDEMFAALTARVAEDVRTRSTSPQQWRAM